MTDFGTPKNRWGFEPARQYQVGGGAQAAPQRCKRGPKDLWAQVRGGYGSDIEGGPDEVARMQAADNHWTDAGFNWLDARTQQVFLIESFFSEETAPRPNKRMAARQRADREAARERERVDAQQLFEACVEKGWSDLLPAVVDLGEELDLGAALACAARLGRPSCAEFLARRTDANALVAEGQTALMLAVRDARERTVEALLPLSNLSSRSSDDRTALMLSRGEPYLFERTRSEILWQSGSTQEEIEKCVRAEERIRGLLESWTEREALVGAMDCHMQPPPSSARWRARSL